MLLVVEDDSRDDLVLMEVDRPVEQLLVVEDVGSRGDLVLLLSIFLFVLVNR